MMAEITSAPEPPACRIYTNISTCAQSTTMFAIALVTLINLHLIFWIVVLSEALEEQYAFLSFLSNLGWIFVFIAAFDYAACITIAYPPVHMNVGQIKRRTRNVRWAARGAIAFISVETSVLALLSGVLRQKGNRTAEVAMLQTVVFTYAVFALAVAVVVWRFGSRLYRLAEQRASIVSQLGIHETCVVTPVSRSSRSAMMEVQLRDVKRLRLTSGRIRSLNRFIVPVGICFGIALLVYGSMAHVAYTSPIFGVIAGALVNGGGTLAFTCVQIMLTISFFRQWKREKERVVQPKHDGGEAYDAIESDAYAIPPLQDPCWHSPDAAYINNSAVSRQQYRAAVNVAAAHQQTIN
ncbi:hypothetical protein THASP1DRAFT_30585 [Thamnocephalis sphaerospora]|uniref:G-protein coupled receptors family 1 profile domain-containing protein n=1 Tax=Thamnocephalis sphaerospora TaxID=78915 RepID=A0A4P9XNQ8_9FUNG|nr:hypothetical protein THASP1DRAFT_30585 [Thamnocephalis sphaerospora]|eukprot:RKP07604.1 hypothetical protein THASP1DRAFT_30585 [Thamnocephalis sphaerospora]